MNFGWNLTKVNINLYVILALALILRLFLVNLHLSDPNFSLQQDNYLFYANALKTGTIDPSATTGDMRLFPGYPIAILLFSLIFSPLFSAFFISILASILAIYLVWIITKSPKTTAFFAFFPPIWIMQGTKIATEPLAVFLLLFSLYLFLKNRLLWSGLLLGLAFDVRIISFCLLLALITFLFTNKQFEKLKLLTIGFIPTSLGLFIYNFFVFGNTGIFKQFVNLNQNYNGLKLGFFQLVDDLFRSLSWHQYRIFLSGSFYIIFVLIGLYLLFKNKKSNIRKICFLWTFFSLIFVLSLSPTPLLEDFGRYLVPVMPALSIAFMYKDDKAGGK